MSGNGDGKVGEKEKEKGGAGEGEGEGWGFIYSFVARGTVVVAEYTEYTGNFAAIAERCLHKLPSSNNRFTYACDAHTFNFLVHDGYAYCVVAKESVPKHVSLAFLERLKTDFRKRYGGGKADTAMAKSLTKEFGPVMKEHMQYIIEHADEIEKLLKVKTQVAEVKNIMLDNIEKTMDRGEKLKDLEYKASDLRNQAQDFKKQGTKVRKKMWLQNMKIKLVVLGILLILVFIIWISVCHGFDCTKHEHDESNRPN
ncbi:Vesicle-associated membrane protein 724 [Ananas comosus]|uniref:Vesicle-associated membrane protein 724 n=1 Tax=Ananas comosus TaxID=4615 RepID=A0A199UCG7_ANACO|nr:Vesicle-associated membrane protein 724 [Ananas comosus]